MPRVRKREFDGKESDVYFNGRKVPEKKVKKQMSRHYSLIQEQLFDTIPIPSTPEAITVATPQVTIDSAASSPHPSQLGLPEFIVPRADLNTFDQSILYPQGGADMQAVWETNSVSTATVNNIINNLPGFQFQALFESTG